MTSQTQRARVLSILLAITAGCGDSKWDDGNDGKPKFDETISIPRTANFAPQLSAYKLFAPPMKDLVPAPGVKVYELSSELFTDYALKQRLLAIPANQRVVTDAQGGLVYPEGTIMAKTFYYLQDMRNLDGPRRVIETRLLIKAQGTWNVATYLWNQEQLEASLLLQGTSTDVEWIDVQGNPMRTRYEVPHEGECVTCHQAQDKVGYIGPTIQNLNKDVEIDGVRTNQLAHLEAQGLIESRDWAAEPRIPDYRDATQSLESRARAYLHINCAHCHNPGAWEESSKKDDFDFRYATPFRETGLKYDAEKVLRVLERGEMPYLGVTIEHKEGVELLERYLNGL